MNGKKSGRLLEDITSQTSPLKVTGSRCSGEDSMRNPLDSVDGKSSFIHSMPSFPLLEGSRGYDKQVKDDEEVEMREATELGQFNCKKKEGGLPVISTVVAVALIISLGVVTVGIVGFLPGYFIGFQAVSGTTELIQSEAVKGVTSIMRTTILQLPDFAHTITSNYMLNQTFPYSKDVIPDNSTVLLSSLLSVLSSFHDTISSFKFYYKKGLYAFAAEVLWNESLRSQFLIGSQYQGLGVAPVIKFSSATLKNQKYDMVALWNITKDLTSEEGTFKTIVEPWVREKSPLRWYPDALNETGLYFNFIIPFKIDGYLGSCEVGMPTRRLLRESRPLIRALRKHGRVMLFDDKRDIVILNSWKQETMTWRGTIGSPLNFTYLPIKDINDPLAAAVAGQVNLHRTELNALVNSTAEFMFPFKKSTVRVSFARITDKKGLNVMLSVAVLRSDFFSTIIRARAIIVTVVILVVMLSAVMALIGSCYLVKPLTHLVKALKKASNLELSADDSNMISRSRILEVEEIQADYVKLLRQLCILRNFVPEAILARANSTSTGPTTYSVTMMENISDKTATLYSEETNFKDKMGKNKIMNRYVKLNSGILKEQLNSFSPKHCTVVAVEMHKPSLWESSTKYMSVLVATATGLSGCVEMIGPEKILVSFGAHTTIPMHSIKGCRFAFEFFSKLTSNERKYVTIVVESNEFLVGACGANFRNARVLFGTEYLFELTKTMSGASYHIAATSGMASQLQGYQVFPVDCVLMSSTNIPVVLFELRLKGVQEDQLVRMSKRFRLGFAAMRQGDYKQAMSHYHKIGKSDPQARRLLRLCEQRCEAGDVTPYIRFARHAYNIHKSVINDSYKSPNEGTPEKEILREKETAFNLGDKASEALVADSSVALFEMYQNSSSETFDACMDAYSGADDMPLFLTDMNQKVWTRSLNRISEGAFSTVYLGMSEDGVQVAIKCIPRRRRDIMQESLEAEMNVASKLRHPNIVQYVSCSVVQSYLAIIMEYVPGGSLHTVIKKFGKVSPLVARRFTVDILNGLNYLHGIGIVHCDVKPHNVLLGMDGVCKLSDFGSTISEAADMARTMVDEVMLRGTALYMAPEVARGGRCTPQSDIFSLGISLLEMLFGRLPWRWSSKAPEGSDTASLHALFNRDSLFVQSLARGHLEPEIPDSLDNEVACFVRSCCHLDPAMRPSALGLLSYAFVL